MTQFMRHGAQSSRYWEGLGLLPSSIGKMVEGEQILHKGNWKPWNADETNFVGKAKMKT
jgi:hypothetical protein